MIAYLDASVLLRQVLGEPEPLPQWSVLTRVVSSRLLAVESYRTLDRLRLDGRLNDPEVAERRAVLTRLLRTIEWVELTESILASATMPMPTVVGTLDAIHLVCALEWSKGTGLPLPMATHDRRMGEAARALGLDVIGV